MGFLGPVLNWWDETILQSAGVVSFSQVSSIITLRLCSLNMQSCQRMYKRNIFPPPEENAHFVKERAKCDDCRVKCQSLGIGVHLKIVLRLGILRFPAGLGPDKVKEPGPQQKGKSAGKTNKDIYQPTRAPSLSERTRSARGSNDLCRNQCDFLDAPDKLLSVASTSTLMNHGCQEQQALFAEAGNKPFPRNLATIRAWERRRGSAGKQTWWERTIILVRHRTGRKCFHSQTSIHHGRCITQHLRLYICVSTLY